jgi:hypothetical protein
MKRKATEEPQKRSAYALPLPQYERERFVVHDADEARRMLAHYGVAVWPDALSEEAAARALTGLWPTLEQTFPYFRRAVPSTWRALRDNGAKHGMLLQTLERLPQSNELAAPLSGVQCARAGCLNSFTGGGAKLMD